MCTSSVNTWGKKSSANEKNAGIQWNVGAHTAPTLHCCHHTITAPNTADFEPCALTTKLPRQALDSRRKQTNTLHPLGFMSLQWLLLFLTITAAAPAATFNHAVIHVAPTGGKDTNSCGSLSMPCATLQYAVSHASPNSTVLAMPGVHKGAGGEGIDLSGLDNVEVTGQGHAVVDCSRSGRGFVITHGQPTLRGFTVRNCVAPESTPEGGGLAIGSAASPVVADMVVEHCEASVAGGGIAIVIGSPLLSNVTVRNNTAGFGGGLFITGSSTNPGFTRCNISANRAPDPGKGGGGAYIQGGSAATFTDTAVVGNTAAGVGGGLYITGSGTNPGFTRCNISANHAPNPSYGGGGAWIQLGSAATFTDTAFVSNTAAGAGGGLWIYGSGTNPGFTRCHISANHASNPDKGGGGAYILVGSATFTDTAFVGNTAAGHGGGLCIGGSGNLGIVKCALTSNTAETGDGGGLWIKDHAANTCLQWSAHLMSNAAPMGSGGGLFMEYSQDFDRSGRMENQSCPTLAFTANRAGHYGNDGATSPTAMAVAQQPALLVAPSQRPAMQLSFAVIDSFGQVCTTASGSVALRTSPEMPVVGKTTCQATKGMLVISPQVGSPCMFGVNQAYLGQNFTVQAYGIAAWANLHHINTHITTVGDCQDVTSTAGLEHCGCDDPSCSCKANVTLPGDFVCAAAGPTRTLAWYQYIAQLWESFQALPEWARILVWVLLALLILLMVNQYRGWRRQRAQSRADATIRDVVLIREFTGAPTTPKAKVIEDAISELALDWCNRIPGAARLGWLPPDGRRILIEGLGDKADVNKELAELLQQDRFNHLTDGELTTILEMAEQLQTEFLAWDDRPYLKGIHTCLTAAQHSKSLHYFGKGGLKESLSAHNVKLTKGASKQERDLHNALNNFIKDLKEFLDGVLGEVKKVAPKENVVRFGYAPGNRVVCLDGIQEWAQLVQAHLQDQNPCMARCLPDQAAQQNCANMQKRPLDVEAPSTFEKPCIFATVSQAHAKRLCAISAHHSNPDSFGIFRCDVVTGHPRNTGAYNPAHPGYSLLKFIRNAGSHCGQLIQSGQFKDQREMNDYFLERKTSNLFVIYIHTALTPQYACYTDLILKP